eukprot:CAMPEP_0181412176 /NCGR_PEP_ID=MMETSP1110-20121109/8285_1 /TAXON_ID=174948 /ORGANISM="Symbiodinium sp., Strain CCMP421" /LENGTH=649 /DNA_ID=CAMNT_0023534877 /DNA_START=37 /DNA_END=1983 /DNA_ORIENTATION=-
MAALSQGMDMEGAKFSMINSMRSGNALYDTLIAMLIPLIFKLLFDGASSIQPALNTLSTKLKTCCRRLPPEYFERTIQVEQMRRSDGYLYTPGDDRSGVLLRALNQYIADKQVSYKSAVMTLEDHFAEVEICDSNDDDDDDPEKHTEIGYLKTYYRITQKAPEDKWLEIENGLELFINVETEDRPPEKDHAHLPTKVTTKMSIKALDEKQVLNFVNTAYQWYLDEQSKMQSKSKARYMYEMIPTKGEGEEKRSFRRYKLSGEKSFSSLFFPEKDALVQLLDHFLHRSGKYSIPGYPHKLGLLLYGPPGTGKTSMIKVLAQHTDRSIVNVPLARINTNTELMQLIFDQKYTVEGIESPVRLRIKDVIFVMEDVDAASTVVHRRDEKSDAAKREELMSMQNLDRIERLEKLERLATKMEAAEKEGAKPSGGEKPETVSSPSKPAAEKPESTKKEDAKKEVNAELLQQMLDVIHANRESTVWGPVGTAESTTSGDKLNLAGILNTLDGVVDTPGRLLVMTSNHPEKLDPALIRPGRIDKMFHLTYMVGEQACKMIAHYFQQELEEELISRICMLMGGGPETKALEITPARLEQLCAEHDEVKALCESLEQLAAPQKVTVQRSESVNVETTLALQRTATAPPKVSALPTAKRW